MLNQILDGFEYGHIMSIPELKEYAQSIPSLFSDNNTKAISINVESITPLCEIANFCNTKAISDSAQSLLNNLFIVNYCDRKGFALISADTRIAQVLAYSDCGNIDCQPETKSSIYDDTGEFTIYDILDLVPYYLNYLGKYLIPTPTIIPIDSIDALGYYYYAPHSYQTTVLTNNYSATTSSTWGQGDPYNAFCYVENGSQNAKTGCVAIAICQLMSLFHKPEQLIIADSTNTQNPITLNWYNYIPTYDVGNGDYALAKLVKAVADAVDTDYGINESGASFYLVPSALSQFGYSSSSVLSYNYSSLASSIYNYGPVLVSGALEDENYSPGNPYRHTWVIDGYKEYTQYSLVSWKIDNPSGEYVGRWSTLQSSNTTNYVRCNWGWDGLYNGYYVSGLFDTNNGNLDYNLKIVKDIHYEN